MNGEEMEAEIEKLKAKIKQQRTYFGQRVSRAVAYGLGLTVAFFIGFSGIATLGMITVPQVAPLASVLGFAIPLGIEFSKGMND